VNVSYKTEPNVRARYKGNPTITISADIRAGSQLSPARVQVLLTKHFQKIAQKHPGVALSFGGEFESRLH
jgi:multidrug efflux pump subunit AcrB